jgi:23S rRNA (guanosine2251-2'-O)-methyltransferase
LKKNPLVVVLDNVRSAHNVGSVFRTCDAFLVERVYLCGITPLPPNPEIHKTALGATDTVDWLYVEETLDVIKTLKSEGYFVCAVEQAHNSVMLSDMKILSEQKFALIFGHEVHGVEERVISECDICLEIPQNGTKHSLNVSVCAGIVIHHFVDLKEN